MSLAARLEALARDEPEFQTMTKAELSLLHAAAAGEWGYAGPPDADAPVNLPEFSETGDADRKLQPWGSERNIRAGLIRWLSVALPAKTLVDPLGLRVKGSRIVGSLNLEAVDVPFPLELQSCRLMDTVRISRCTVPNLSLAGSWTKDIVAIGLVVSGSVVMNGGFHADGEIDLVGAKIDGDLDFMDATILHGNASGGWAIVADNLKATNVQLSASWWAHKGFRAEGTVSFPGAMITGDFGAYGAEFTAGLEHEEALNLQRAVVGGRLTLGNVNKDPKENSQETLSPFEVHRGLIDLRGTRCHTFEESDWRNEVLLDGFTYEITERQWEAKTRIPWLEGDTSGATQPYYQLARYFEGIGKSADAKQVRIALEKKLYPQDDNPLKFLKKSIGYGYRPENALIGIMATCLIGWIVYRRSHRMGLMVPSDTDAAEALRSTGKLPPDYPRFHPLIASLENTFPLIKLGQADNWQPDPSPASPFKGSVFQRLRQLVALKRSLRWIVWAQILLGWLLATLFVAAVTGLIRHGG